MLVEVKLRYKLLSISFGNSKLRLPIGPRRSSGDQSDYETRNGEQQPTTTTTTATTATTKKRI